MSIQKTEANSPYSGVKNPPLSEENSKAVQVFQENISPNAGYERPPLKKQRVSQNSTCKLPLFASFIFEKDVFPGEDLPIQFRLIEELLHKKGAGREISIKIEENLKLFPLTEAEKIQTLGVLLFWLDRSNPSEFEFYLQSIPSLFAGTQLWLLDRLTGSDEENRRFLLRTFSEMLFTRTGTFNSGGIVCIQAFLQGRLGSYFEDEHCSQIVAVMQHFSSDLRIQHLLQNRQYGLTDEMRHFIRAELGLDRLAPINTIHMRRACLYAILHDLTQHEDDPNCALVATLRYTIHHDPYAVLELFLKLFDKGEFSIYGQSVSIARFISFDQTLSHSSRLQQMMLAILKFVSLNSIKISGVASRKELFIEKLCSSLNSIIEKYSSNILWHHRFIAELKKQLWKTLWIKDYKCKIFEDETGNFLWFEPDKTKVPTKFLSVQEIQELKEIREVNRLLFVFDDAIHKAESVEEFQISLLQIIDHVYLNLCESSPDHSSVWMQIAHQLKACTDPSLFNLSLANLMADIHQAYGRHLRRGSFLLEKMTLFIEGDRPVSIVPFLLGKQLKGYLVHSDTPSHLAMEIFSTVVELYDDTKVDIGEDQLILVRSQDHLFTMNPNLFREFWDTDDIDAVFETYVGSRNMPSPEPKLFFSDAVFYDILSNLPIAASDHESIRQEFLKAGSESYTPYQFARKFRESILAVANQWISLTKTENVIRDVFELPRIISLADLNWEEGAKNQHTSLILKPAKGELAFYLRAGGEDYLLPPNEVEEFLRLEIFIPKYPVNPLWN